MTQLLLTLVLALSAALTAQHPQDDHAQMAVRGAKTMGFDQAAATYHFHLHEDGGAIQVTVNDPEDKTNLEAVRAHLPQISKMFAAGDFSTPHFIHEDNVPGTEGMTRLRDRIAYAYEDIPNGGRVRITTRHARALSAVHGFLRYQITEHKTGDPLQVIRRGASDGGPRHVGTSRWPGGEARNCSRSPRTVSPIANDVRKMLPTCMPPGSL